MKFEKAAHKTKKELTFQHRNIDENAINRMKILLSQIDWSHLHTFTVENAYQNFIEKINRIINTVAPLKKVTIKPNNVIKDPWMTRGLMKSSRTSARLYHQCVHKSRTSTEYKKYIKFRNIYNILKRNAKSEYYAKLFEEYKNDVRKTFKVINKIIGKTNNKSTIAQTFKLNNKNLTNPQDIADQFCNFFTNIGPKYANDIPASTNTSDHYLKLKTYPNVNSIFF